MSDLKVQVHAFDYMQVCVAISVLDMKYLIVARCVYLALNFQDQTFLYANRANENESTFIRINYVCTMQ